MAIINEIAKLGDVFISRALGDVLFDSECLKDDISEIELIQLLKKKVLKKGGLQSSLFLYGNYGT